MEPYQPGDANHGHDIDDLIGADPSERSQTPLQHISENRHHQCRPDARTGEPGCSKNAPNGGCLLFHAEIV